MIRVDPNLYWQAADGTGSATRLTTASNNQSAATFSPNGASLILRDQLGTDDLSTLSIEGKSGVAPLFSSAKFNERNAEISPDGGWLAYESDESGQAQVYVRPFPRVDEGRWQVSTGGGTRPLWARSGRELFYQERTSLFAVPVQTAPSFRAGKPVRLMEAPIPSLVNNGRSYDASPDGQRFVVIKESPAAATGPSVAPTLTIVLNWTEELKRLLPAN